MIQIQIITNIVQQEKTIKTIFINSIECLNKTLSISFAV